MDVGSFCFLGRVVVAAVAIDDWVGERKGGLLNELDFW